MDDPVEAREWTGNARSLTGRIGRTLVLRGAFFTPTIAEPAPNWSAERWRACLRCGGHRTTSLGAQQGLDTVDSPSDHGSLDGSGARVR